MENLYSSYQRIYGKRERGIYSGSTFRWKYCLCTDSVGSSIPAGIQFALYTMCGGYRFDQTWNGQQMGCWCCGMAVCDCLGGCADRTSDRDDLILLIRFYRKTDGFDCFQSSPSVFFQFLNWEAFIWLVLSALGTTGHLSFLGFDHLFHNNIRTTFPEFPVWWEVLWFSSRKLYYYFWYDNLFMGFIIVQKPWKNYRNLTKLL